MKIILGSRSPRRRELLQSLIGPDRLEIRPPVSENEEEFDGLRTIDEITRRLLKIVDCKYQDVRQQLETTDSIVICADTVVVALPQSDSPLALGKPPEEQWESTVTEWFARYYSGRTHEVWTGIQIGRAEHVHVEVVRTKVTMPDVSKEMVNWYLKTREPLGKAGGYGIQGHASAFIDGIEGSLTNVIGLPMLQVANVLQSMQVPLNQQA